MAALQRDGFRCTVPGCGQRASVVDHIVSRRTAGADTLANLRSLCREHDNQVKERERGARRSAGKFTVRGCDANGIPRDPAHPWSK
jgi:5-methylcytosine-specific restriction endonuclease McrA